MNRTPPRLCASPAPARGRSGHSASVIRVVGQNDTEITVGVVASPMRWVMPFPVASQLFGQRLLWAVLLNARRSGFLLCAVVMEEQDFITVAVARIRVCLRRRGRGHRRIVVIVVAILVVVGVITRR